MDWVAWHASYDDRGSSLARRLQVVRTRIGAVLDAAAGRGEPVRILSLCAGDGRDILPQLAARPALDATTTLVELDEQLVARARTAAAGLPGVHVRHGDAGLLATYDDVLPVDLLLLCGILGTSRRRMCGRPCTPCRRCSLRAAQSSGPVGGRRTSSTCARRSAAGSAPLA